MRMVLETDDEIPREPARCADSRGLDIGRTLTGFTYYDAEMRVYLREDWRAALRVRPSARVEMIGRASPLDVVPWQPIVGCRYASRDVITMVDVMDARASR